VASCEIQGPTRRRSAITIKPAFSAPTIAFRVGTSPASRTEVYPVFHRNSRSSADGFTEHFSMSFGVRSGPLSAARHRGQLVQVALTGVIPRAAYSLRCRRL